MLKIQEVNEKLSLGADNLMLRGSSLKNTEYVYGIAVFTGHDTKIMKNSAAAKYKFSSLEKLMNKTLIVVFLLQIILALVAAVFGTHWELT
jgi:magnesium-transporting ATPase (P-type)